MSYKITNLKSQTTNKLQIQMYTCLSAVRNDQNQSVWNFVFVYCDLSVIWNLLIGAYPSDRVIRPGFLLADNFGNIEIPLLNKQPPGANLSNL
ncbi:MAG: hypothetical protein MRK02_17625 [Candidatus Scalindua sp.]|nr:hypothetical protein [Candidatus Scalindua sp.]